ncbi:LytR/AlgR family response regulator transcription factor [Pedobacter alluvionis]|uniref:LytTR family two component transcriptional regulator n=1 Tax=Pedobacter alluvionis TaxID=475253 RepID=A0A497XSA8_9SPHI|nr:response regulator transcription factor [Pedobacter alluvionis]RLJ72016.1 LytTR family two component transcriptional regulator [Pedobacter alluvionis]TFB28790.1 response regulator transcription factor [Pedobacter alluvionis]
MRNIRTLIIDDERGARQELMRMLKSYPQITVLGEATNADEAEQLIGLLKPELIFLDIQMPGRSGFDLLENLVHVPQVIFVTAFDSYAVQAFEVSAMDYLMKPVRDERFKSAIDKAIEKMSVGDATAIFVKDRGKHHLIKWKEVHLIESVENYARLFFGKEQVLLKTSLNKLEEKPDCQRFFRASRSILFNLDYISSIKKDDGGMFVELKTGNLIRISERQAVKLRSLIKI